MSWGFGLYFLISLFFPRIVEQGRPLILAGTYDVTIKVVGRRRHFAKNSSWRTRSHHNQSEKDRADAASASTS